MAGTIVSGTYTSFFSLNNPATQRPVTVTGKITNASGQGIIGDFSFAWTVNNQGTVEGNGATSGFGIQLLDGGTVNNAAGGLITGYSTGILIEFAAGTVGNLGTIKGTGVNGVGINVFDAGGTVVNGSAADTTALISGVNTAAAFTGGAGNVTNFGTIASTSDGQGISLHDGGSVTNGNAASTAALISSAAGHTDVYISGGTGAVTNFATIRGGAVAVFLGDGGRVSNGSSSSAAATIVSDESDSVLIAGTTGTIVNFGTLQMLGTVANIVLDDGGSVTNGGAGATNAAITGTGTGIYINNAPGTVTNFGHITVTSTSAGNGVTLEDGGSVSNFGTIQNADTASTGVYIHAGGSVSNAKGARIAGANNGISIRGGVGTVTNAGSITGSDPTGTGGSGNGIYLIDDGSITNQSGGVIAGHNQGVYSRNFAITVTNSGLIETTGSADGVYLRGGGTITNNAGGTISGSAAGVALGQHGGAVTNHGVIKGVVGFYAGIHHPGANTLVNFGTVASTAAGGVAVEMGSSVGLEKLLVVEKGAVFTGLVEGGGRGEIEFANAGAAAMGGNISGFNTVVLASGGADSLTLANANFGGVDGRMTVIGGNKGNTVNAAAVTTGQLTIEGGAGKDVLTGANNGGTIFVFTAATLTASDKITGSGFNNELDMTTAGTVAAGGVSAVQLYRLADGGANKLVLTNANFTGLLGNTINVYGGNDGNTIDGSGLTGAGDNLAIYAGAGHDVLKGGSGNDNFIFANTTLSGDTISGGGGNNELQMTTSAALSVAGVSGVETYVLGDGGANTLALTAANFAGVAGGAITVSDGGGGNTVSLAASVPAADHVVVYAGTGVDKLTGGAGGDVFFAGGKTVMTGKAGANQFTFSAPGSNTLADFAVSAANTLMFVSGAGFSLTGAGATPKPLGALFTTGAFTNSTQRFAYSGGKLFYSATGSSSNEKLVATLTGSPTLDPAHLLFMS